MATSPTRGRAFEQQLVALATRPGTLSQPKPFPDYNSWGGPSGGGPAGAGARAASRRQVADRDATSFHGRLDTPHHIFIGCPTLVTETTQPAVAPWRTEQLRLTAFPKSGRSAPLARDWWNAITGTSPERITEEPRTGVVQLRGTFEGASLFMRADDRLDIRQLFVESPTSPDALPVFADALPPFIKLAVKWLGLDTRPQIQRLAFGAVAIKPSAHLEDCRRVLDEYLPSIDMKTTELRDFLYQVNRRRSSETISGLEVNRLMKWSVQHIHEIVVTAGNPVAVGSTFASRLEVDINSDSEYVGSLRPNRLVPLFQELIDLADKITMVGDHP